jgi:phosphoglycolate phosphatase-like HAD superfamily hydrolase
MVAEFQGDKFMRKRKNNAIRISKAKVTDDDRTIYAILRDEFTAADLQKYTEIEPLIPAEHVLARLEKSQRRTSKRKA